MTKNKQIDPPADLLAKILQAINKEKQKHSINQRLFLLGAWFLLSLILAVPELGRLMADLRSSGFADFFGLLFSDFSIVSQSANSFFFSLLQTLPAFNLALSLMIILMILKSGQLLARYFKKVEALV